MLAALRAPRFGTSLALGTASATVLAVLLLTPAASRSRPPSSDAILTARLASGSVLAGENHVAVTIEMPNLGLETRPPLSLAIVIDRSGSMQGEAIRNAKAAAARLVDQLGEGDAFSVITYSNREEVVVPMTRATSDGKANASEKIADIWADGSTCISCGITRGAAQLANTPVRGGVRRIVLISDGQPTDGLMNRAELADLVVQTAASGVSLSSVGVGDSFDEVTMMRLADAGHGNYYYVDDTNNLASMFSRELAGLTTTVAADARLVIDPAPGVFVEEAYGYELLRQGSRVVVSLPDLRADQPVKVVLRTTLADGLGARDVGHFELHWRQVDTGAARTDMTDVRTNVTADAAEVAASIDRIATTAIEQARTARVLEDATIIYERDGAEAAQRVLERHRRELEANKNLDAPAAQALDAASNDAIVNFSKAPAAKAKKAARSQAYELAR